MLKGEFVSISYIVILYYFNFVIDKRDLFIDNYPIWLIDTTNMLQKYERIDNKEHNGKPVHTAMNTVSAEYC